MVKKGYVDGIMVRKRPNNLRVLNKDVSIRTYKTKKTVARIKLKGGWNPDQKSQGKLALFLQKYNKIKK